jgi:hypothetical protein
LSALKVNNCSSAGSAKIACVDLNDLIDQDFDFPMRFQAPGMPPALMARAIVLVRRHSLKAAAVARLVF